MCSVKPIYELEIKEPRIEKALAIIKDVASPKKGKYALTFETVLEVFHQLGWADCITYVESEPNPEDKLRLDLTDVQYVALAAALAAVSETGGKMVRNEVQGTLDAPAAIVPPDPIVEDVIVLDGPLDVPAPIAADPLDILDLTAGLA